MTTSIQSQLTSLHLETVMQGLYDSGIYCAVYDEWDAGWRVQLDRLTRPIAQTLQEAAAWLHVNALRRYPGSTYASFAATNAHARVVPNLTVVLKTLYDCEERVHVRAVIGTGWNVGFQGAQTTVPSLRTAAEWLANQGRVRIYTPTRDIISVSHPTEPNS